MLISYKINENNNNNFNKKNEIKLNNYYEDIYNDVNMYTNCMLNHEMKRSELIKSRIKKKLKSNRCSMKSLELNKTN